jgi:flagellar hook-associated protein 3 FlgL
MNIQTVSTLGMSLQSRKSVADNQRSLLMLQQEQASGKRFDVAGDLGALGVRAIRLREMFNAAENYQTSNRTLASRLEITQSSLSNVTSNGNEFVTKIIAGLHGDVASSLIQAAARDLIDNMEGALNTSFGGRSLFSGSAVDAQSLQTSTAVNGGTGLSPLQVLQNVIAAKPAVIDSATLSDLLTGPDGIASIFDNTNSVAAHRYSTTFYNGNTQSVTAKIDETSLVPGGARADDPGVTRILKAAYTLAAIDSSAMPSGQYRELLTACLNDIEQGMAEVQQTQAMLGLAQQAIESAQKRHSLMADMATRQINELEQVDPFETAVRLSNMATQIESTFSITARISRLSLINYL